MKISVVVPVYNVQDYLHYAMDSLMNQTYKDFEVILVNDGSTDRSGVLCQDYAAQYENVHYISKDNGGLSDARNMGVAHSASEWVTFLDPDDYLEPYALEAMVAIQQFSQADLISTRVRPTKKFNEYSGTTPAPDEYRVASMPASEAFKEMMLGGSGTVSACGKLYNKRILSAVPFPVGKIYEDFFVVGSHLLQAHKVVVSPIVTYHYYKREGSIVNSKFNAKQYEFYEAAEENRALISQFGENEASLYEALAIKQVAGSFHIINLIANSIEKSEFKRVKQYIKPFIREILGSHYVSYKFKIKTLLFLYATPLYLKVRKMD